MCPTRDARGTALEGPAGVARGETAMRVRRVTNSHEFWASLRANEPDVLPLWFTTAERDRVARTIDPDLAALAENGECAFATIAVSCGRDDIVLAAPSGSESLLAARYAAITGRRVVLAEQAALHAAFAGPAPRSITWFCPLDEDDLPSSLALLHEALKTKFGNVSRVGVLTAENASKLSWVAAKQLLPQRSAWSPGATTMIYGDPVATRPLPSTMQFGSAQTVPEIVAAVHAAEGTLLLSSHSRPHCGLLHAADGLVGVCGLPTGGAGGRCVDGTACHFGESPRVVLQDLQAQRIYYNGCTTAGVGTRRTDFLPRSAMICHAALRGRAREFVGNVRSGYYSEMDTNWFLGASALGYTPAECVGIVEAWRERAGLETMASCLYFGDATNPAWPIEGVLVGEAVAQADRLHIGWPRHDRVLVARVPDKTWADLAGEDRLGVRSRGPSWPCVMVIPDPWEQASIVLVIPRAEEGVNTTSTALEIELNPLATPADRTIGEVLACAIEHLRWLALLPTFATLLADAPKQLEEELVTLRRVALSRDNLMMLEETLSYLRKSEAAAATRFDGAIVDEAISRSTTRWNWSGECAPYLHASPRKQWSACPGCGGFANDNDLTGYANRQIRRTSRFCGYCGMLSDLPAWGLRVRMIEEALIISASGLTGCVEVSNDTARPLQVTMGATIRGAGEMAADSVNKARLLVEPGASSLFEFTLKPARPATELMQAFIFIASEAAFGVIGRMLLFGRDPSSISTRTGPESL
jgi:hypothetical protein